VCWLWNAQLLGCMGVSRRGINRAGFGEKDWGRATYAARPSANYAPI